MARPCLQKARSQSREQNLTRGSPGSHLTRAPQYAHVNSCAGRAWGKTSSWRHLVGTLRAALRQAGEQNTCVEVRLRKGTPQTGHVASPQSWAVWALVAGYSSRCCFARDLQALEQ